MMFLAFSFICNAILCIAIADTATYSDATMLHTGSRGVMVRALAL